MQASSPRPSPIDPLACTSSYPFTGCHSTISICAPIHRHSHLSRFIQNAFMTSSFSSQSMSSPEPQRVPDIVGFCVHSCLHTRPLRGKVEGQDEITSQRHISYWASSLPVHAGRLHVNHIASALSQAAFTWSRVQWSPWLIKRRGTPAWSLLS
jgi:hypothetical protein